MSMSNGIDKNTQFILEQFGLSDKEVEIYSILLKMGPSTIVDLSKSTGIKRTTTHNNVDELISKGLVSQLKIGGRRKVMAENPDKLRSLMDVKKSELDSLSGRLEEIITSLSAVANEAGTRQAVQVKYFEGQAGVNLIYQEALASEEIRSYVNLNKIITTFEGNFDLFSKRMEENKSLVVREIIQESTNAKEFGERFAKNPRFTYKLISKDKLSFTASDILIFNGKVAIINVADNTSGIVITNNDYYILSTQVFDLLWNTL